MFRGEALHSIDTKGRIIIPQKYREHLGDEFVVTKGLDACLYFYPANEYKKVEDKLREMPMSDSAVRQFVRFFVGNAADLSPDASNRVLLPATLRKFAKIEKEALFIGAINRIELWSPEHYDLDTALPPDLSNKLLAFDI